MVILMNATTTVSAVSFLGGMLLLESELKKS
jgi:hypothetical protein